MYPVDGFEDISLTWNPVDGMYIVRVKDNITICNDAATAWIKYMTFITNQGLKRIQKNKAKENSE